MIAIGCEECGRSSGRMFVTFTGRIEIDGRDNNSQSVSLCEDHYPDVGHWKPGDYQNWQPRNCKRVRFVWPQPGVDHGKLQAR